MRRFILFRVLFVLATAGATLCLLALCHTARRPGDGLSDGTLAARSAGAATGARGAPATTEPSPTGLVFSIAPAAAPDDAPAALAPPTPTTPLEATAVARLLARLPVLSEDPTISRSFAFPARTLPAPRAGETVEIPFPPPAEVAPELPPTIDAPLTIERRAPEGEVPLAARVSVTFSHPIVPVATIDSLAAEEVPLHLSPLPPGRFRFVGTRTLLFEPEVRLPAATDYTVVIPAGTAAARGREEAPTLAEEVTWRFSTPPPQLTEWLPVRGPQRLDPTFLLRFDQEIDPAAVLATVEVRAGGEVFPIELVAPGDLAQDDPVAQHLARRSDESDLRGPRTVVFQSTRRLPPDTTVTVRVGPGTPSAEGPRKTETAQAFDFRTFGPFTKTASSCGWRGACRPLQPWSISFSNPLDHDLFEETRRKDGSSPLLSVAPPVDDLEIEALGRRLSLRGATRGQTRYTVKVAEKLTDQFGQELGREVTAHFNVDKAEPYLHAPGAALITLDPFGPPVLSLFTINHPKLDVRVFAVEPRDWEAFLAFQRRSGPHRRLPDVQGPAEHAPPGALLYEEQVSHETEADVLTEFPLDLARAFGDDRRHVVVEVQAPSDLLERHESLGHREPPVIRRWIQRTALGLDAVVDHEHVHAWTNRLEDGAPVAGAQVELVGPDGAVTSPQETSADGVARLPADDTPGTRVLVAEYNGDQAILPRSFGAWSSQIWGQRAPKDALAFYVFDDRRMYRPGETVSVKGFVRELGFGKGGGVALPTRIGTAVSYSLHDSRRNEITSGATELSPLGGFDLSLSLPPEINLGAAMLTIRAQDKTGELARTTHRHSFQVQEFRRPEFEVRAQVSEGPHFVGEDATVTVSADYYAGAALPGAPVSWEVQARQGHFAPPGHSDYSFGVWRPWWRPPVAPQTEQRRQETGTTAGDGKAHLQLSFESAHPPLPTVLAISTAVEDVNRQRWSASENLLVHPADVYVGIRTPRAFVPAGAPIEVALLVADLEGEVVADRSVTVEAVRFDWTFRRGRYEEIVSAPLTCTFKSGQEPSRCSFATERGGRYRVRATVTDSQGRLNRSERTIWVAGGDRPPTRGVTEEELELIPDRERYSPGETAELLVQTPFTPAEGLVSYLRGGVLHQERFRIETHSHTLKIPVTSEHIPGLHVDVMLVGATPRVDDTGAQAAGLPPRPAHASGRINLRVPPRERALALEVSPRTREIAPGAQTTIDLQLRDALGAPLHDAEVALVVVDEAVLALSGYRLGDPLTTFYPDRGAGVSRVRSRASVLLSDPAAAAEEARQMGDAEKSIPLRRSAIGAPLAEMADMVPPPAEAPPGSPETIAMRDDLRALAHFAPLVRTDRDGKAAVEIELPDNLTRYRVMAVAVAGGELFGMAESSLTARLPLAVRPSPPRFLNFGDHFELPVVVQNRTATPLNVEVALRAANARLIDGPGRLVTVPADDRVEVRFPVATEAAGRARFQVAVSAGEYADAASFDVPVWTPATTEAFATYGTLADEPADEAAAVAFQPLERPTGVISEFGALTVSLSSTALQELTDAVLYLVGYPYEGSEQVASRLLGIAALKDVLEAFEVEGRLGQAELEKKVAADIQRLIGRQNRDGGFPLWRRGAPAWPYVTVHVTHALVRAQREGFEVPEDALGRALRRLRAIEQTFPGYYTAQIRRTIKAYALYVRALQGDVAGAEALALWSEVGLAELPLEAIGWLLPVLHAGGQEAEVQEGLRFILGRVTETAEQAHFATSYGEGAYLLFHSSRRVDAVLLEALLKIAPEGSLPTKLVRGLLAHRTRGRWHNTQENVFVLLALNRYFRIFESETPDFVARLWWGERFAAEKRVKGRTPERATVSIPMKTLLEGPPNQDLALEKRGAGRMYYRIGLSYAPEELQLDSAEHGFVVERRYEAVDDPDDVRLGDDQVWRVRAGARVRVRVQMVAPGRRTHVALVDPLPGGFEPQNPALAVTEPIPQAPEEHTGGHYWWWRRPWFEHQNLRDDRAEAFASLVWAGVHEYSYTARATTPGTFIVPPAKAEEMYAPETFGRSKTARVLVY